MRAIFVLLFGFVEVVVLCMSLPGMVRAAEPLTHIADDIHTDTVWIREAGLYMLDKDISVDPGVTLKVGPGVRITGRGSTPGSIIVHGSVIFEGSPADMIDLVGLGGILVDTATATISYVAMHDGLGIRGIHAQITIASSTLYSLIGPAIRMDGGVLRGWNLKIQNASTYGLISGAFASPSKQNDIPQIDIHRSAFVGNVSGSVYNSYTDRIHLEENWWDSMTGPLRSGINSLRGPVSYEPALEHDPTDVLTPQFKTCCSSVLFIPGLEGTRLYDEAHTRLWEPVGNENIRKLHLNEIGSSTELITADDPIDFALGLRSKGIYGSFVHFMDGLVSQNVIREWKSFGYDWRDFPDYTASRLQDRATSTESLVEAVDSLARRSPTGKVTIIAHSNGGLVAKSLIMNLSDAGHADLIDTLISVAVPYLGAPEAIADLLHGDHQSIAGGLFASQQTMRDLGLSMPSAYGLIPSAMYFLKSLGPAVVFASTTMSELNDGSYPASVESPLDLRNFLTDTAGARTVPRGDDVSSAAIANGRLLSMAEALHAALDAFYWPVMIVPWTLFGSNRDTTTAIEYHKRPGCDGFFGKIWCGTTTYFHRLATSLLGDGTVPVQSASFGSGNLVSLDLDSISRSESRDFSHANILESTTTQTVIRNIISTPRGQSTSHVTDVPDVSPRAPVTIGVPMQIRITLNGDARVSVRDESGTDVSAGHTVVTGSGEGMYTEVSLSYGYGHAYAVSVYGSGYGFFTMGVERLLPGQEVDRAQYATEPLSPIMIATTTIDTALEEETDGPIMTTLPPLVVDINGDGTADYVAGPDGNGLPGNASTAAEADRIAREQSIDTLMKTDTPTTRNDPARADFINELFPPGTNGPLPTEQQKTPPSSGSASCPSP